MKSLGCVQTDGMCALLSDSLPFPRANVVSETTGEYSTSKEIRVTKLPRTKLSLYINIVDLGVHEKKHIKILNSRLLEQCCHKKNSAGGRSSPTKEVYQMAYYCCYVLKIFMKYSPKAQSEHVGASSCVWRLKISKRHMT